MVPVAENTAISLRWEKELNEGNKLSTELGTALDPFETATALAILTERISKTLTTQIQAAKALAAAMGAFLPGDFKVVTEEKDAQNAEHEIFKGDQHLLTVMRINVAEEGLLGSGCVVLVNKEAVEVVMNSRIVALPKEL